MDILRALHDAHPDRAVLATRLADEAVDAVLDGLPDAVLDPVARAVTLGPLPVPRGTVTVVSAGTSDAPVAAEAALTARVYGAGVNVVTDVGVAGLHRVLAVREDLLGRRLPGRGGRHGGRAAQRGRRARRRAAGRGAHQRRLRRLVRRLAALLGDAELLRARVTVVNIDNGFGAGVFAARVARNAAPRPPATA